MFRQEKSYYRKAFLTALLMGVALLLPFVALDRGYFVFYGDFNAQQIPFYKTCINAVRSGNLGWNWQTDLGANFVGSYSFYTLGSPFFWLAALFPAAWSQYLMAPLMALKLGLSSLFAFMYIRRFVSKPQTALIGGILYAFSGFSMYNIFFNHFHEAICFFPLLLIGLEEAVVNKRRGVFALAAALNAFVNYFFFIGECVFLVIYFVVRLCMDKRFRISVGDFLCLAFESVVGVMIAGILFVPSIYQVLDVPRATDMLTGWNFLFYGKEQRYGLLLEGMFLPPEIAARNTLFPEADAKWSSVALYLPLFSMAGVIAFIKGAKKHWARVLLAVCLVMAFVPGLNSAFVLFNSNFYTRWFYMPELICCLATVYVLEHSEIEMKTGIISCAAVLGVITLLSTLAPFTKKETAEDKTETSHIVPRLLDDFPWVILIPIALGAGFLVVLGFLIKQRGKMSADGFLRRATAATVLCGVMFGYYYVGYGRILGPYLGNYNKTLSAEVHIDDIDFFRMEALDEMNNVNMLWNMSSEKSFTSIIPSSTFELYDLIDINRSVNSAPEASRYAFRALARVKYIFVPSDMDEKKREKALTELEIYEYMETQGDYDVYSTEYALPMGCAYDTYVYPEQTEKTGAADKLMVRSVVLTDEQAEKFSDILSPLPPEKVKVTTLEAFKNDAKARIADGVSQFSVNRTGFTAMSSYDRERLVVFSVPFDKGWSAQIDGADTEIEKVNGGFMAVRVPAGVREISFRYRTPGGALGAAMTAAGAVLCAAYIGFFALIKRHKPKKYVHLYAAEQISGVKAHGSYISQLTRQIYECPEKGGIAHTSGEKLSWPELETEFMATGKIDFSKVKPKKRTSHITEDDEAYNVLKELDEQKRKDDELK